MRPRCPNAEKHMHGVRCAIPERDGALCCYCRHVERAQQRRREGRIDDGPDDTNDPATWPDGMGRLGWRRMTAEDERR